jgi:hypothetical protein
MLGEDGKPIVGSDSNMLGVRIPPHKRPDIFPDADGNVSLGVHGMSVAPTWRDLPPFLIPKRLEHLAPDARGRDELICFRYGDGDFIQSPVTEELFLKPNSPTHGTVQPAYLMSSVDFQASLAATRDDWKVDEA